MRAPRRLSPFLPEQSILPTLAPILRLRDMSVRRAKRCGLSLVVRNDSGIQKPEDFHGKRVASPQLGNTQDVALRAWLQAHGLKTRDKGGDVQVLPIANPDQLTLFLS